MPAEVARPAEVTKPKKLTSLNETEKPAKSGL